MYFGSSPSSQVDGSSSNIIVDFS